MIRFTKVAILMPLLCTFLNATAETYKCIKGGQKIFSDLPCAVEASRVDQQTDSTSREQRKQAEAVHRANRQQLSELEYQAARDRYTPRRAYVYPR